MFRRWISQRWVWVFFILLVLSGLPAKGLAASGGEFQNVWDTKFEISRVLNFLVVALGLYFILRKPLRKLFSSRREGIEIAIKEAEDARAEANRLREDYERRTAELEKELSEIRSRSHVNEEALRSRLVAEGDAAADRVVDHARFTIEQESKKAESQLRTHAALLALELAEEVLKRELGPEDQRRFFQDYLAKVGEID